MASTGAIYLSNRSLIEIESVRSKVCDEVAIQKSSRVRSHSARVAVYRELGRKVLLDFGH